MTVEELTQKIQQKIAMAPKIEAKVKLDFGDDGVIFIDACQSPPVISHDDAPADTTLSCSLSTLAGILNGTQDPTMAFMMGKLKVQGNMGLAMKLNAILED